MGSSATALDFERTVRNIAKIKNPLPLAIKKTLKPG
jgi:hypothetical protein